MSEAANDSPASEPSPIALFRYLVVSQVLGRVQLGERQIDAVCAVTAVTHNDLLGHMRRVSERSVHRWVSQYLEGGVPALANEVRATSVPSHVLPEKFMKFLATEKKLDREASIPEMIRRADKQGIIAAADVDRVTVYRACKRANISVERRKKPKDMRRWSYPNRMNMVLCDGKHFRAGVTHARRVGLFFLDDCSRLGLDVIVGTSETTELFLTGLHDVITHHGLMSCLYLDNGSGFISHDTAAAVAALGITLILGTAGYPEGHGKIERFNRTAKADVLRGLDGRPDVDARCPALRLRLRHYLREEYGHHPHESIDFQTPWQRWNADPVELRLPADRAALHGKFAVHESRRVTSDNVIPLDSVAYEMPRGHAGTQVIVRRHLLDQTFHFLHQGRLVQLHPVDAVANARSRRARDAHPDAEELILPRSAADMGFDEAYGSIVDADGGFHDPQ